DYSCQVFDSSGNIIF
nr:immunoglobulin light chain junction region [Macaca mulatta]